MLFNSFLYTMVFLPLAVCLCALARKIFGSRAAQGVVLIASLAFYASWKWHFLPFLAASILANWLFARLMQRSSGSMRAFWFRVGLVANVVYLASFKYINFLLHLIPFLSRHTAWLPNLPFPVGISFFTLSQIMYLVDCYQEVAAPHTIFDHATFVSFFPYVISGPIPRAKRMLHQFANFGSGTTDHAGLAARGIFLFAVGLFKKVVVAEQFAAAADIGFYKTTFIPFTTVRNGHLSGIEALVFGALYTFQIYFDFSAYSDMAIGSALMLGIEIPRNFDAPLRSASIIEFWQRWHISLSEFITSYLYTPILRSFRKASLTSACIATLIAMSIAGLWHGPALTFVIFGFLHGAALCINQVWRKRKFPRLPRYLAWLCTFLLVDVAFIFFRSASVGDALYMLHPLLVPRSLLGYRALLSVVHTSLAGLYGPLGLLIPLVAIPFAFVGPSSESLARDFRPTSRNAFATAALIAIAWGFLTITNQHQFVYFKF